MRKKTKALKAVEPNAGVRKAYTKAVTKIERDFQSYVLNRVLLFLESKHVLAEDSELTAKTPEERQKEKLLKRKILTEVAKAHPEMLKADVERFVSQNMGAWSALLATASRATVTRFIKAIAGSASAAQRQAFIAGKVTKGIIDKVFQNSIPTVQTRYISSRAMAGLTDAVKDNVNLITKIGADDVARLSDVLLNGLQNGLDYNQIKDELRNTEGFTDKRVETVCRDQVAKITTKVQTDNAIEAGFNEAIWVHVPGTYTSRVSHIHMDGKKFRLDEGLYDEVVHRNVMPGEEINCRCVYKLVVPEDLQND